MPRQAQAYNVESEAISGIGYEPDRQRLTVIFNSGRAYTYSGVSQQKFVAFRDANSKGRFLNYNIKGIYPYRRIA